VRQQHGISYPKRERWRDSDEESALSFAFSGDDDDSDGGVVPSFPAWEPHVRRFPEGANSASDMADCPLVPEARGARGRGGETGGAEGTGGVATGQR